MEKCRCGHEGDGDHPCHAFAYTCRKPATQRFIAQQTPYSIAGMQPKVVAHDTWACDDCWATFKELGGDMQKWAAHQAAEMAKRAREKRT
jgi:hypothetical protein